jgi:tagaturonate reductase
MTRPTTAHPVRVLQFGTGRFLRGFVDAFLDEENRTRADDAGTAAWAVTAVETSGSGAADRLRAQGCRYRLLVRGLEHGRLVKDGRIVEVIDQAIDANHEPVTLEDAAQDPEVSVVVSNTTEAGYHPERFPARLSSLLEARARVGLAGVTILPCELIEDNGRRLRALVVADARRREVETALLDHIADANLWGVTLVDRIATVPGPDETTATDDPFTVVVEPYASWVVEAPAQACVPSHPAIERTEDVRPFALRKIRILNGAHTALVARTRGLPLGLVREAMAVPDVAAWLEDLLREEIVPALGERIADGERFVRLVLERFRNPFLDHRLDDIAVGHADKVAIRLVPTYDDYVARFGRPPRRLAALLADEGALA